MTDKRGIVSYRKKIPVLFMSVSLKAAMGQSNSSDSSLQSTIPSQRASTGRQEPSFLQVNSSRGSQRTKAVYKGILRLTRGQWPCRASGHAGCNGICWLQSLAAFGDLPDLIIMLCEVFGIYIQHISQKFPSTTNKSLTPTLLLHPSDFGRARCWRAVPTRNTGLFLSRLQSKIPLYLMRGA